MKIMQEIGLWTCPEVKENPKGEWACNVQLHKGTEYFPHHKMSMSNKFLATGMFNFIRDFLEECGYKIVGAPHQNQGGGFTIHLQK